jgi:hypothetical protein
MAQGTAQMRWSGASTMFALSNGQKAIAVAKHL